MFNSFELLWDRQFTSFYTLEGLSPSTAFIRVPQYKAPLDTQDRSVQVSDSAALSLIISATAGHSNSKLGSLRSLQGNLPGEHFSHTLASLLHRLWRHYTMVLPPKKSPGTTKLQTAVTSQPLVLQRRAARPSDRESELHLFHMVSTLNSQVHVQPLLLLHSRQHNWTPWASKPLMGHFWNVLPLETWLFHNYSCLTHLLTCAVPCWLHSCTFTHSLDNYTSAFHRFKLCPQLGLSVSPIGPLWHIGGHNKSSGLACGPKFLPTWPVAVVSYSWA